MGRKNDIFTFCLLNLHGGLDFGLVSHNVHDLHSKGMKNARLFHEDLLSQERERQRICIGASYSVFSSLTRQRLKSWARTGLSSSTTYTGLQNI